jgi:hypothetical protein
MQVRLGPGLCRRLELAQARMESLNEAKPDNPYMLSRAVFSRFHHDVFSNNGSDEDTFGGDTWDTIRSAYFTNYDWCPTPACMPR